MSAHPPCSRKGPLLLACGLKSPRRVKRETTNSRFFVFGGLSQKNSGLFRTTMSLNLLVVRQRGCRVVRPTDRPQRSAVSYRPSPASVFGARPARCCSAVKALGTYTPDGSPPLEFHLPLPRPRVSPSRLPSDRPVGEDLSMKTLVSREVPIDSSS